MGDIRNYILTIWSGTNTNLNAQTIKELYLLYDKYAFYGQIENRVKELNNVILTFQQKDPNDVDIHRCCGISHYKMNGENYYNLKISHWMLSRIKSTPKSLIKKYFDLPPTTKKLTMFLMVFDHMLTHLLFLLWKQYTFEETDPHNTLFSCVYDAFFPGVDIVKKFSEPNTFPPPLNDIGRYTYWNNSCYLDSLTSIFYLAKTPIYRNAIFTTNNYVVDYKNNNREFLQICSSEVDSDVKFTSFIQHVQSIMYADYMELIKGTNKECRLLRNVLSVCYPDMKEKGKWGFYSITEIYNIFTKGFPVLTYKNCPIKITKNGITTKLVLERDVPTFTFWEFMEPLDEDSPTYSRIDWDNVDAELLVFQNGGYPAITNFGSSEPEKIILREYVNGVPKRKTIIQEKSRNFEEYILGGKYKMFGAVVLSGTRPGQSGGIHYTSYVDTLNDWFYYNDSGDIWRPTKNGQFPKNVLTEKNGIKPELYFYQRT